MKFCYLQVGDTDPILVPYADTPNLNMAVASFRNHTLFNHGNRCVTRKQEYKVRQVNDELQRWALIDRYTALMCDLLCIPYSDLAPCSLVL